MRKMVKPPKVCEHCGTILKAGIEEAFCDYCKNKIPKEVHYEVGVFWKSDSDAKSNEFCSWDCFVEWLHDFPFNKKRVEFISLPYIGSYDTEFPETLDNFLKAFRARANRDLHRTTTENPQ